MEIDGDANSVESGNLEEDESVRFDSISIKLFLSLVF
jgi:hypothetical protein